MKGYLNFLMLAENINPQASVAQKTADQVVFRNFQGEGVEFFFKSDRIDPALTLHDIICGDVF